jgi:hypothetical protein
MRPSPRLHMPLAVLVLLAGCALSGAQKRGSSAQPPERTTLDSFPATAPDSFPKSVVRRLGYASGAECTPLSYIPGLLRVVFRPDAPVVARRAAIEEVGGRVVGGFRLFRDSPDGFYLVEVPVDRAGHTLCRAQRTLATNPHVRHASLWADAR